MLEFEESSEDNPIKSQKNPWLGRVGLVLFSAVLSSVISVTTVCLGWKASIDTLNAVSQVKIIEHEEKIKQLDRDTVKTRDLVYRDQLLDAKLASIDMQIHELKDQVSDMSRSHQGR